MIYLLPQLVDEAAEANPGQTALICREDRIDYETLASHSGGLAGALAVSGVRPGDRVGVYMGKTVEAGVAINGIMKAGAAYVPLDPVAPAARLDFVIRDCGITHLVTGTGNARKLPALAELGAPLDLVIGPDPGSAPYPSVGWHEALSSPAPGTPAVTEQDLCYILYTSGSTGTPKGIMHTHRSALSWANLTKATYGIGPQDIISNYAPLHFDLSTLDFFGGPAAGATVVMIPEEHMKMPASLAALLEDEGLTLFYTVPLALIQLAQPGVLDGRDLSSLTRVLFGGEPMPVKHLRSLMSRLPGTRFYNVYGPTETNGCTHHEVKGLPGDVEALPIGRPYPNVEAQVVDADGCQVVDGEVGELLVRAPTMMKGYWNRPDLNEAAFEYREVHGGIPDVFHRTGDLVHRSPSGELGFHGRKDRQIKSRGYRVELDEVEAALLAHPDVAEAAVYTVGSGEGSKTIRAAVLLRTTSDLSVDDLVPFLSSTLPSYAVPERVEVRTEFPRTSSGKIDRRTLEAEAAGGSALVGSGT